MWDALEGSNRMVVMEDSVCGEADRIAVEGTEVGEVDKKLLGVIRVWWIQWSLVLVQVLLRWKYILVLLQKEACLL